MIQKGRTTTMGMAASQARFLGLTARKNNVEFEGQQINQQRTALSNQSANYYNNLLGMSVPVPPSVDNFTKTVYTFTDGALTNQITAMIAQPNGNYTVSYLRQWTDDFSVVSAATSIVNANTNTNKTVFKVGANTLRCLTDASEFENIKTDNYVYEGKILTCIGGNSEYEDSENESQTLKEYTDGQNTYFLKEEDDTKTWFKIDSENPNNIVSFIGPTQEEVYSYTGNDEYLKTLSSKQIENLMKEEANYNQLLKNKYDSDSKYMVRYVKNSTTEEYEPYFYKQTDLEGAIYDENGNSKSNIDCYKIGSETRTEEVKALQGCQIEKDSSGRYINITIPQYKDGQVATDVPPITYALTTQTATDQAAYEDAMNQYEYEKYEYDQAIQEINAKIEIVQSEDKNLELRLKQLDTEQKAIQTEIEAVGQVIQKNTETSFKTFG